MNTAWTGWYRISATLPWSRLVEADTEDACWLALMRATFGASRGQRVVTRAGRNPDSIRPPGRPPRETKGAQPCDQP
jgi:hypothetical protein